VSDVRKKSETCQDRFGRPTFEIGDRVSVRSVDDGLVVISVKPSARGWMYDVRRDEDAMTWVVSADQMQKAGGR